jgi:tetratricopeptide (TPR) repeat protein
VQSLLDEEFANVGRVMIYVDVCRAGMIGTLRRNDINSVVEVLVRRDNESLGIMASGPGEFSVESDRFGGGHGAFTYFLARGLNGDADEDRDGRITSGELFDYVWDNVRLATKKKQNPRQIGSMPRTEAIAGNLAEAGIELAGWRDLEAVIAQSRSLERHSTTAPPVVLRFEQAMVDGRITPTSAEEALRSIHDLRLLPSVSRQAVMAIENRLSIALQDQGQQVILRYLRGDAVPQTKSDFNNGEVYFQAALDLDPDAWALRSRALFCHGRREIFDKRYMEAIQLLERAVRIEPEAAYGWNALGIGYLESADYTRAAEAFRDAIRRAPRWVYPRHNLALALSEQGEIADAELAYRDAMRLAPGLAHLPYNLGLLFQRTNRRREAEAMFRKAIALAPESPEAYNALGLLKATNRKNGEAEALYRQALEKRPGFLPARQNLALILASRTESVAEAFRLWQQNLTDDPDFMPSRVSLAETLAQQSKTEDAIREYRELVLRKPQYLGARLGLAEQLERAGQQAEAVEILRESVRIAPDEPAFSERLGDLLMRMGKPADAEEAYLGALNKTLDPRARKQLQKKSQTRDLLITKRSVLRNPCDALH